LLTLSPTLNCYHQQVVVSYFKQWLSAEMSEGERPGENVQIPERRTQREGCDATATQPTHGDADAACSRYVYSHCSCREAVRVLMIVNELSCRSSLHRRSRRLTMDIEYSMLHSRCPWPDICRCQITWQRHHWWA